jgi:hypothetical protein
MGGSGTMMPSAKAEVGKMNAESRKMSESKASLGFMATSCKK